VKTELLKARQTKYVAYASVYILVVLTLLVVANALGERYNKSYDSTANKRYSLSEQTAKIAKGLKQDATLLYFQQPGHFQEGKDLLDEYANLSTQIHVRYVDPDREVQLARDAGIKNYGTAVVEIGAKKEIAQSMTEEGITGAFIRALKGATRTVCFVTGSGEHQIDNSERHGYSRLKDLLGRDAYEAKSIDLLSKAEVPGDCTALVVGGPSSDYVQPEVDAIKKYVEDGGRALFLLDPPLKSGRSPIADNDALTSLLASWGVTVAKDLVIDLNPISQLVGAGPLVALVTSYDSHPIVNEMSGKATGFPIARSLEVKSTDKTTVEKLFDSSASSLATTDLAAASVNPNDPKNKKGPLTLAAAGTYNTGKANSEGRFVVIGSSSWIENSFLNFQGNSDLALDAMNWLSSDEDLISIRPKEPENRPITMTSAQMSVVLVTSVLVLPLLVVAAGLSVWWKRR